jgi:hypothetical protein
MKGSLGAVESAYKRMSYTGTDSSLPVASSVHTCLSKSSNTPLCTKTKTRQEDAVHNSCYTKEHTQHSLQCAPQPAHTSKHWLVQPKHSLLQYILHRGEVVAGRATNWPPSKRCAPQPAHTSPASDFTAWQHKCPSLPALHNSSTAIHSP